MRSKSNVKKDSKIHAPELKQAIKSLNERAYNSQIEYHDNLSAAASIIAKMSAKLASLEADVKSKSTKKRQFRKTFEVYPKDDGTIDSLNIQKAIDRAWNGDRILLKSGTFKTGAVIYVWKDLVIEGEVGAIIVGSRERGKVITNPATNSAFILVRNCSTEFRNIHFKELYSGVVSLDHHKMNCVTLENNTFENVYHSVYLSGIGTQLIARNNKIIISSLDQRSCTTKFNYYEESHIFGFYCTGISRSIIEDNHIEVLSLQDKSQFHSIGIFCSLGEAIIRNNFFKGLHAPLVIHDSESPIIMNNQFYGMSSDPVHTPVAIRLEHCIDPYICSNNISCKLSEGSGINVISSTKGKILSNEINLAKADCAILIHKSDDFIIGKNGISSKDCAIGIFGNQSTDSKGNLVFSNSENCELLLAYTRRNTIIGKQLLDEGKPSSKLSNMLINELELDSYKRRERIEDHLVKLSYPDVPKQYIGEYNE